MPKPAAIIQGKWWRFDKYEIRNGLIRPAPGATLAEYDPWVDYWASRERRKNGSESPVYKALFDMLSEIDARKLLFAPRGKHEKFTDALSERQKDAITKWCADYGLLCVGGTKPRMELAAEIGRILDGELSPEAFWQTYEEPVQAFLSIAYFMNSYLVELVADKKGRALGAREAYIDPFTGFEMGVGTGLDGFNRLLASVHPWFSFNQQGRLIQEWRVLSLREHMVLMMLNDMAEGSRPRICGCCGIAFISSAWQAKYCSDRCRMRQQKRDIRRKHREMAAQADSPLGQDI